MLPLLKFIKKKREYKVKVILTDQHVNNKFGNTYKICKKKLEVKTQKLLI